MELTRERFEVPEDFTAEKLTGGAFGLVREEPLAIRVRLAAEIAHLATERVWHPSQRVEREDDGSVILTLEAGGKTEILAWLYGFVPHVEVRITSYNVCYTKLLRILYFHRNFI